MTLRRAAFALSWLSLAGCEAVLGVEDVVLDGAGGAGGGPASTSSVGVGAGFAVSAGSDASSSTGGDVAASSGSGCQPEWPPCPGATANAFDEPAALEGAWTIERRKVEVKGKHLELDPDDTVAALRSAPIAITGTCAVWVTHRSSEGEAAGGIAVGDALPGAEQLAVFRAGNAVGVTTAGQSGGTLALDDPAADHVLRLRFDGAGSVAADVKGTDGCYRQVGSAVTVTGSPSIVLFQLGEQGKTQLDDYCK